MNKQHLRQTQELDHDAFLSTVGSLLTQRVVEGPSPHETKTATNFADYLRIRRQQLGLTRATIAQKTDATEFDIYVLEQGMLPPRQIGYVLLRRLAGALDEDVKLLALILERDIAECSGQRFSVASKLSARWMDTLIRNYQQSICSFQLSTSLAIAILSILLILPSARQLTPLPANSIPTPELSMAVGQHSILLEESIENRNNLEIVYTDADSSTLGSSIYFSVNKQRVATVNYSETPVHFDSGLCDVKFKRMYRACPL